MFVRLALIISLTAQLALNYRCCGVQIIRPDVVMPACDASCMALGACVADIEAPESCCEVPVQTYCGEQSTECCGDEVDVGGCEQGSGDCTPPVEQKKTGPDAQTIDIVPFVAHPVVPALEIAGLIPAQNAVRPMPRWTSNHDRQAWLAVWLN